MMGDHAASKIDHKNHLILDQPLLRLPYELLLKNFRSAHTVTKHESDRVKTILKETTKASVNGEAAPDDVLKNIDTMLARMRGLKRKLATYADEETRLYQQLDARVDHLRELSEMHTVEDVKYEAWSRQRLDRLLVDYLLRRGYNNTATQLADERGMKDLADIDTFVAMIKIRKSLEGGNVAEALAWCNENKKELRKMESNLEFMLRCQQYVEMVRTRQPDKMLDAIAHCKKFISPYRETYPREISHIAGLLAITRDVDLEPYRSWYSPERWKYLADLFVKTHNQLLGLPSFPLLHVALSSGLSALKTPACHSTQTPSTSSPSQSSSLGTSVCPICSTELNDLAKNVPYAHHSKSHVEHDLMLLPNGRVYGKERLEEYATKAGLEPGKIKDLVTGDIFEWSQTKKVFIT